MYKFVMSLLYQICNIWNFTMALYFDEKPNHYFVETPYDKIISWLI